MLALRIIEHLNVFEYVLSCVNPCRIGFSSNLLAFQQLEEAFGDSVVMTVAATAHTGVQIVLSKKRFLFTTGELAALIRMDRHRALRLTAPDRHQQSLQSEIIPTCIKNH